MTSTPPASRPSSCVTRRAVLLDARDVDGAARERQRWTGFTSAEEAYVERNVGQRFQPFWIEDEAKQISGTTFVAGPADGQRTPIRSGNLITGQQQNSGAAAAKLVIEDLG